MGTCFLVGAGFCIDANRYFPDAVAGYPLVDGLAKACFPVDYDLTGGVEPAFANAQEKHDFGPIGRLIGAIQDADYYVGGPLSRLEESDYSALFEAFPACQVLSFNYDCLLEMLLFRRGLWTPVDGFGVKTEAKVDPMYVNATAPVSASAVQVIHLHGTPYLYPVEFEGYSDGKSSMTWLRETSECIYRFDADALRPEFIPFEGGPQGLAYKLPPQRIIAPLPDKAPAMADRFVEAVYAMAGKQLSDASVLIAIGYRFAECDRASYEQLLQALGRSERATLILVAPDAKEIAARLSEQHKNLNLFPVALTFRQWAGINFSLPVLT